MQNLFLAVLAIAVFYGCDKTSTDTKLPDIKHFQANPSDRFIVDMQTVQGGHMYLGKNTPNAIKGLRAHEGAHVTFDQSYIVKNPNGTPKPLKDYTQADIDSLPSVYAVADGVVFARSDYYPVTNDQGLVKYQYVIDIKIAKNIIYHYAIEPYTNPKDPDAYKKLIFVNNGDKVKKGDIIAKMFVVNSETHIHHNLIYYPGQGHKFQAPLLFTNQIIKDLYTILETKDNGGRYHLSGSERIRQRYPNGTPIKCMGFMLQASENPYGKEEACINH